MDSWPHPLLAGVLADAVPPFPLQALYMFYALAIVCDDFFVPSLEKICEVRGKVLERFPDRSAPSASIFKPNQVFIFARDN